MMRALGYFVPGEGGSRAGDEGKVQIIFRLVMALHLHTLLSLRIAHARGTCPPHCDPSGLRVLEKSECLQSKSHVSVFTMDFCPTHIIVLSIWINQDIYPQGVRQAKTPTHILD